MPRLFSFFVYRSRRWPEIALKILFAYQCVTYGWPSYEQATIDLPDELLEHYVPPDPNFQDGLLATYMAQCEAEALPVRMRVLDYFMTCFQTDDRSFELACALDVLDKPAPADFIALSS